MSYLFTSESVSEGHPDKVADQISDALLDEFLARDPESKVAIETFVTTGQVIVGGEVRSKAYVDVNKTIREVIKRIGYTESAYQFDYLSCGILSAIHEQSADINRGVDKKDKQESPENQGAGDQGMMFGYATDETDNYMPLPLDLAHSILRVLSDIRNQDNPEIPYLRPDAKSQVTIEYDEQHNPLRIHTIVVSTQHDDWIKEGDNGYTQEEADKAMQQFLEDKIRTIVIPKVKQQYPGKEALFADDIQYHVNPTGKFVIGGPHGDTGLTGRKIIVDTYGGKGAHGGGAFSGKDPSKVDRSAAYAARYIAKHLVAAGVAKQALVQLSYAIGVAKPMSIYVNTYGTNKLKISEGEIAEKIGVLFDLRPKKIEDMLNLRKPVYLPTASYGHVGREYKKTQFKSLYAEEGSFAPVEIELFTWEKIDDKLLKKIKDAFGIG